MNLRMQFRRIARKILHTPGTRKLLVRYRHRGLLPCDTFLASYPRSGSTWLQFLLYELLSDSSPEFIKVNQGIPYVGNHLSAPNLIADEGRLIKTHEPYLQRYKRAIYMVRDPRDVIISEYRYMQMTDLYRGNFDKFIQDFIDGKIHGFGSWNEHVQTWLEASSTNPDAFYLLRYRDLKAHPTDQLTRILSFLDVAVDLERIEKAVDNNSLERMKNKENEARRTGFREFKSGYRFVNKGSVGGWKNALSPEFQKNLSKRYEPILKMVDDHLPY